MCAASWATWPRFTAVLLRCFACAVSCATWLLFTVVSAWCVILRVQRPGPLGSSSPVCPLGTLRCVCVVLGHLAPVHRCARSVRCVDCALSWATWFLVIGVAAWCVVLHERCPGPLGSCSPVSTVGALCSVCGVLGHLAPVHRCPRPVCCAVSAVYLATWLLFTGMPARCAVLCVRRLWATWLLFIGVLARCVVLRVQCPGSLGSCSSVCPLGALCCVCSVLGHLAPVHRCARCVHCLRVRFLGPLGS